MSLRDRAYTVTWAQIWQRGILLFMRSPNTRRCCWNTTHLQRKMTILTIISPKIIQVDRSPPPSTTSDITPMFIHLCEWQSEYDLTVHYLSLGTTWMQEIVWLICNNANIERAKSESLYTRYGFLEKSEIGTSFRKGFQSLEKWPKCKRRWI